MNLKKSNAFHLKSYKWICMTWTSVVYTALAKAKNLKNPENKIFLEI
jgi:hypothetical protein